MPIHIYVIRWCVRRELLFLHCQDVDRAYVRNIVRLAKALEECMRDARTIVSIYPK